MKKLIVGALIALSMVVGASASEGEYDNYKTVKVKDLNKKNLYFIYNKYNIKNPCQSFSEHFGVSVGDFAAVYGDNDTKVYKNGITTLFLQTKKHVFTTFVFFEDRNKCLSFLKEKHKLENIFKTALVYKLKIAPNKSCQKIDNKEDLLNKIKKYDSVVVNNNTPEAAMITLKKGKKQAVYYFSSTLKGCKNYQKVFDNLLEQRGKDPYFN